MIRVLCAAALLAATAAEADDAGGAAFNLVDHDGRAVSDRDYRGSYLLVFFGYSHCPDVCPTSLAALGLAMDALGADGARVQPLFVSVDPARDTPERLAAFVGHFHPRLVGLTGTPEQVARAAAAYRARYRRADSDSGGPDYLIDHTAALVLAGPDGRGLAAIPHGAPAADVAAAVRRFMALEDGGG